MTEFINKISRYNFLNYLFTGRLFVGVVDQFTKFSFIQSNLLLAPFIYYFIGLVISRIGSLLVEPILEMMRFIHLTDYHQYLTALKNDPSIEILSEANNLYRTLCSLFLVILFLKGFSVLQEYYPILKNISELLLTCVLFIIFLFSYRKQTKYITKRITKNI